MKPGTKIALGLIAGVAVGGAAGYFIATSRAGKKAIDVLDDPSVRLPDPSYAVELAVTDDQFEILDELVCECGDAVAQGADETDTLDGLTRDLQNCMARELYPDFPWPPIPGDHPSAQQLYAELGLLARRAVVTGEICPESTPALAAATNPGAYR